jgi:hypothetical protein
MRPLLSEFVDPALVSRPDYQSLFQFTSGVLARCRKWNDAAAVAGELRRSDPTNSLFYHMEAPLLVANGGIEEYRRLCTEIVSRFHDTTDPYVADKMAKDCLILPSSGADLEAVAALADRAVSRGSNSPAAPHFKFCKALAEFRLGHFEDAVNWANLALQGPYDYPKANAAAVIAMSQFKLSQMEKARTALAYCDKIIEEKMPKPEQDLGDDWPDWIIVHALRSEATRLLGGGSAAAYGQANPPR